MAIRLAQLTSSETDTSFQPVSMTITVNTREQAILMLTVFQYSYDNSGCDTDLEYQAKALTEKWKKLCDL